MDKNNNNMVLIAIVAIVAIVGIVVVFAGDKAAPVDDAVNSGGLAISKGLPLTEDRVMVAKVFDNNGDIQSIDEGANCYCGGVFTMCFGTEFCSVCCTDGWGNATT